MTQGIETRLDGETLVVRVPMRFQRRGGRKHIVAPDGSELAPTSKPQPDGTLVKAIARAWRWQKLLDEGVYTSVTEIPDTAKADQKLPRVDPAIREKGPLGTSTLRILPKAAQCWLQGRAGYAESRSMSHRASRPRKVIAALRWETLWSDCWETKA